VILLQSENQSLKLAASQSNQNAYFAATLDANTAELIRRLGPTPIPAYTVPAPYPYGVGCGCNSCGC
jgi:alpha-D-ribose 1-methylphosphonate 5-phosphate C-P lyase